MEYRILGRLEADSAGRRVALGGWQQRALLAVLLLERGRAVSVDRLIDELWGKRPPKAAERTVRVYVSQLRKLLGEDALETRERGYALRVEPGALDADRFQKLVIDGHQQAAAGNRAAASQTLLEAFALWRGPPLAEFAEAAFARAEIARLEELRLGALEDRFELALANGEAASLVSQLEELCLAHPLRERFCAQLMTALYQAGRQADALAAYRRARGSLAELGIDPSESLNRLHTQMLRHDPGLDPPELSRAAARPPAPTDRRRRLPPSIVALVGVLIATVAVAAVLVRAHSASAPNLARSPQIVLIIGAPPPTNNGQPIETAPTIASILAAGADALRRQGIEIRVVYAPATSRASRAQDAATIRSAAKHAQLAVIFPPTQPSLTDIAATARRYPRTRFVLIDRSVHEQRYPPNVTGMPFDNAEVGYLAGYLATLEGGHPPTASVVAGIPIPPVAEIIQGFRAGAHRANPHGRVLVSFSHTFSDPTVCETLANHQISSGSKVVFNVAGTCGFGALHAADVRGVWAIGVDTDLSSLSPAILASVVKRFDNAVQLAARLFLQHRLPQATDAVLNLGNDGVDVVGISSSVPAATRSRIERIAASLRHHDNTKLGSM